jgi:hypothetical protein
MEIFISSDNVDKTTPLLQYTYELILDDVSNNNDSYAFFITSKNSNHLNNLNFGKYEVVSKSTLDRIHIKYIEKFEDLISFLDSLLFINEQLYPSVISFDKINLVLGSVFIIINNLV